MEVKRTWSNSDFKEMGWHDSRLYQLKFPDEECDFVLYIDYIFKWVEQPDGHYKFWVSPCELTFKNVINLEIDISFKNSVGIDISEIKREKIGLTPNKKMTNWRFIVDTDKGNIELVATDFDMKVISQPKLIESQDLSAYRS